MTVRPQTKKLSDCKDTSMKKNELEQRKSLVDAEKTSSAQIESLDEESEELFEDEQMNCPIDEDEEKDEIIERTKAFYEPNPDDKELSPFAKIIKNYLENLAQTDEDLNRCLDTSDKAYKMCEKWIMDTVKEGITHKSGCQVGVLSDEDGYTMMKEFFLDGVFALKMAEEKEKELRELEKKAEEQEKKRRAEEKKRHEEEWKAFMQKGECKLSRSELDREKLKHLKEQFLFDF